MRATATAGIFALLLLAPAALSMGSDLMVNGGFEEDADLDGRPDGWSAGIATVAVLRSPIDPRAGDFSLQVVSPIAFATVGSGPITIPNGTDLLATAEVNTSVPMNLVIQTFTSADRIMSVAAVPIVPSGEWQTVSVGIHAHEKAFKARVSFQMTPGAFRADNVTLVEV